MDIHCVTRNLGRRSLAQTWVDGLALAGGFIWPSCRKCRRHWPCPRASTASREIFSPGTVFDPASVQITWIAYRMSARWRQENYFKYAREHFALDALDSYADHDDDPTRQVPNPAKARALAKVSAARGDLAAAHAQLSEAIAAATIRARHSGSGGKATVDPAANQALTAAETALAAAQTASRATISHCL